MQSDVQFDCEIQLASVLFVQFRFKCHRLVYSAFELFVPRHQTTEMLNSGQLTVVGQELHIQA